MKAKDYFEKYKDIILTNATEESTNLVKDLLADSLEIQEMRHATTIDAQVSILKETNLKFNSIGRMLETYHKMPILKQDGFLEHCKQNNIFVAQALKEEQESIKSQNQWQYRRPKI